jgi:hypothetical protein
MEAMMSNLVIESRQSVVAKPKWAVSMLNPSELSSGVIAPIVSGQYFFIATQRGGIFLVDQSLARLYHGGRESCPDTTNLRKDGSWKLAQRHYSWML